MKTILFCLPGFLIGCCLFSCQKELSPNPQPGLLFDGTSLKGWEIPNFGPQGPVWIENRAVHLGMGDGLTGITWQGDFPRMNYRVTLDAMREQGIDFFCGMTFPVDSSYCTWIVGGWGGMVVGFSNIDGENASENQTSRLMKFERNRWYHLELVVQPDTIKAFIDGQAVITIATKQHRFSMRSLMGLSTPFGLTSWQTTAALKNIRVASLDTTLQNR
ncbi:DUF1080 domain-containing protein [candidate division KSB1 bacterium]|nr:DUF1080 domain-containing protein [candidate division KSB1 bacterium]